MSILRAGRALRPLSAVLMLLLSQCLALANGAPVRKSIVVKSDIRTGTLFVNGERISPPYTIVGQFELSPDTVWLATLVNDRAVWEVLKPSSAKKAVRPPDVERRRHYITEAKRSVQATVSANATSAEILQRLVDHIKEHHADELDSIRIDSKTQAVAYFKGSSMPDYFTSNLERRESTTAQQSPPRQHMAPLSDKFAALLERDAVVLISPGTILTFPGHKRDTILAEIDSLRQGARRSKHIYVPSASEPFRTRRERTQ